MTREERQRLEEIETIHPSIYGHQGLLDLRFLVSLIRRQEEEIEHIQPLAIGNEALREKIRCLESRLKQYEIVADNLLDLLRSFICSAPNGKFDAEDKRAINAFIDDLESLTDLQKEKP